MKLLNCVKSIHLIVTKMKYESIFLSQTVITEYKATSELEIF